MRSSDKLSAFLGALRRDRWDGLVNLARYASALVFKPQKAAHEPLFLHIEPTVECNLRCAFCIAHRVKRRQKRMSLEQFQALIGKFRFLRRIVLTGAGEPLLHPEIARMIAYAKSRGIAATLTTNATLLDAGPARALISSGLDEIDFSLDGADEETYRALRPADFESVTSNIKTFITMRNKAGRRPRSAINFLAQAKNIEQLPLMPGLASSLGVDEVKVMPFHTWGQDLPPESYSNSGKNVSERLKSLWPTAKKAAKRNRVKLSYLSPCVAERGGCLWPWRSCYITSDGRVTYCCVLAADPDRYGYGDIFTSPVREIWNAEKIALLRKRFKSKKDCPYGRSLVDID